MARGSTESPIELTTAELKGYEKSARNSLKKELPNLDLDSVEGKTLLRIMVNMRVAEDKLIADGVPASVVRQAISDYNTMAGTLLQAFGQRRK